MKILLSDITVKCSNCGEDATGWDINQDHTRFHDTDGMAISLPSDGLTLDQAHNLGSTRLICELCQEDQDE